MGDKSALELHISAAEGFHLQDDCFVAVKIGDVTKQARYRPDRAYRFPGMASAGTKKPHVGKIELFKQIGSCRIEASAGEHEVWVESTEPREKGQMMKLKLHVAASRQGSKNKLSDPEQDFSRKAKADIARDAKGYLSDSNIETMLSDAVRAMLRERPENPRQFVINHLTQNVDVSLPNPSLAPPPVPPQPGQGQTHFRPQKGDFQLRPAQAQQQKNPQLAPIERSDGPKANPHAPMDGYDILGLSPSKAPQNAVKPQPPASQETDSIVPAEKAVQVLQDTQDSIALAKQRSTTKVKENVVEQKVQKEQEEAKKQKDEPWLEKKESKESESRMQNGSLQNAVTDIRAEVEVKQKDQNEQKEEDAKQQVCIKAALALTEGMESGKLQEVIIEIRDEPVWKEEAQKGLEVVRSTTKAFLAGAMHTGRLSSALSSLRFIAGLDSCRKKTKKSMLAAMQNGKLSSILHSLQAAPSSPYSAGPPVASLAAPGNCVFGEEWSSAPLLAKTSVSHDTKVFTFGVSDASKSLGLSTCACILARGGTDESGNPVVRPYTPVSTNAMVGKFELMVKIYPGGKVSQHMNQLEIGETMDFKHIDKNVKILYPFGKKRIGMIVGGTGITPMIQALHALLGTEGDATQINLLYGSKTESDILMKKTIDHWSASHKDRFSVTYVLSEEPTGSSWTGGRGFIGRELVEAKMPTPNDDCIIFVCGPPQLYDAICGPRNEKEVAGLLADIGYSPEQVYKF